MGSSKMHPSFKSPGKARHKMNWMGHGNSQNAIKSSRISKILKYHQKTRKSSYVGKTEQTPLTIPNQVVQAPCSSISSN